MLGEIVKFVKALREGWGGGDEYSGWHYGLRWPLLSGPKSGCLKQV